MQLWVANLEARVRVELKPSDLLLDSHPRPLFGRMRLAKKAQRALVVVCVCVRALTVAAEQKKGDAVDAGAARGSKKARTAESDDEDDDDDDDEDVAGPPPLAPPPVPLAKQAAAAKPPAPPLEDGEEALSSLSSHSSEAVQKEVVTDNLMLCQFANVKVRFEAPPRRACQCGTC